MRRYLEANIVSELMVIVQGNLNRGVRLYEPGMIKEATHTAKRGYTHRNE